MPAISIFYGITVYMYSEAGIRHQQPHLHARYGESEVQMDFHGTILSGKLPKGKQKLLEAWIEIHAEDLMANWKLLQEGEKAIAIEPLK